MRRIGLSGGLWLLLVGHTAAQTPAGEVIFTDHNLSVTSSGPISSDADEVCILCHIPHTAREDFSYLWNREYGTQSFDPYQSSTLDATTTGIMGGTSRLCLGCHDGTIALGHTLSSGTFTTSGGLDPDDRIGSNLVTEHPFSFLPVDDGQIFSGLTAVPPLSKDPSVRFEQGMVVCISCHEPHVQDRDPEVGKFLVRSNSGSALCLACHDVDRPYPSILADWDVAAHSTFAHVTTVPGLPYASVSANGCLSCHAPHATAGVAAGHLLRDSEEDTCLACHGGSGTSPALLDLTVDFAKVFAHPTLITSGLHDPAEDAFPLDGIRHAECMDCHNPHAAGPLLPPGQPPGVTPPQRGATGVDASTGQTPLRPASNQYEICLKCHGDSTGKPQAGAGFSAFGRLPRRQRLGPDPYNKRLEFQSGASRHNVTFPRQHQNSEVPSLRQFIRNLDGSPGRTLGAGSQVYCTDCHNSDTNRSAGGTGAAGVHGSIYPHLLERRYEMNALPGFPGGSLPGIGYQGGLNGTYALCNKCHDIDNSILDNRSFDRHERHVVDEGVSCAVCHAPHGVSGGNPLNHDSLINFDLDIVGPSTSTGLGPLFERTEEFGGQCFLTCHGEDHDPFDY